MVCIPMIAYYIPTLHLYTHVVLVLVLVYTVCMAYVVVVYSIQRIQCMYTYDSILHTYTPSIHTLVACIVVIVLMVVYTLW